jgi:hypothetical protein
MINKYMTSKAVFQKMLRGIPHIQDEDKHSYENMGINTS